MLDSSIADEKMTLFSSEGKFCVYIEDMGISALTPTLTDTGHSSVSRMSIVCNEGLTLSQALLYVHCCDITSGSE